MEYLKIALDSVYFDQVLRPKQIVIVADGKLTQQQDEVINEFSKSVGNNIVQIYKLKKNMGLAFSLNHGLKRCKFDLVARMDSDDISLPHRFLEQIKFMKSNPTVDVCGTYVNEINPETNQFISTRKVPLSQEEIYTFAKKRNPINHPSVIFRKDKIVTLGGYPLFRKSQDFALWCLLLKNGLIFSNIGVVLLEMRSGDNLLKRRGVSYLKYEIKVIKFQRKINFISTRELIYSFTLRAFFRLSPVFIRKILYKLSRIV
ncbi:glycosyltransferase [Xenorhabdus szentirmaii]|nr:MULTISPECIES: glycosyltransferase [unclassified Xenorhabdus]